MNKTVIRHALAALATLAITVGLTWAATHAEFVQSPAGERLLRDHGVLPLAAAI